MATAKTSSQLNTPKVAAALCLILLLGLATEAAADQCTSEIRRNNIVGNAIFTLMFRSLNGEVNTWGDVGESLGWGAGAGYLFYKSRVMIGEGDESRGIATTYLASSITENVTLGKHPFAKLRYGVGPVEVAWHTPFAKPSKQGLSLAINTIDAIGSLSLMASGSADNFKLRNGVLTAEDRGAVRDDFSALAINRTIVTRPKHMDDQGLWHHELIHATQYLQFSSFGSTRFNLFDFGKLSGKRRAVKENEPNTLSWRVEWFNTVINQVDKTRDYEDRWREIEAARLAQHTAPDHDPTNDTCSAQLGFQFRF